MNEVCVGGLLRVQRRRAVCAMVVSFACHAGLLDAVPIACEPWPGLGHKMTPTDTFVARANIVRMRRQIAVEQDAVTTASLQQLLEEQMETLRAGEAGGDLPSPRQTEAP